jgi:fructose-1,6-bisphosphatase/inositol monophosphatase family enzyme
LVATGRIEAMVDPVVSRWDVSAMAVIVREAGGSFTDFGGNDALANEAVSCTPGVRDAVLGAFRA